ncbi:MAG: hypothetical protein GEU92_13390 [Alphaproteobacteria bacterium]|nr:hypothetical protein [Alphaproteobacteria bacterium]
MADKRVVEIFSAGCAVCEAAVEMVRGLACESCDVRVLDMNDAAVAQRLTRLGGASVPAVAIDGALAVCCARGGPDAETLKAAGLGVARG